ncbi:MAG TPA: phosphatase PAP2 family protein [Nitrolancea sp.]|nr:phosphatase PAP2 family protein [Nitrolancea sp.]
MTGSRPGDREDNHCRSTHRARARLRSRYVWIPILYLAAYVIFVRLRAFANQTGIPVRFRYPIQVDHALFAGHDPTVWLQATLRQAGHINWLDSLLVAVYVTYFFVPHLVALYFWLRRDVRTVRYVLAFFGTLYVGLIPIFLVPTAPPWLASERGYLPPFMRVVPTAINHIIPGSFGIGDQLAGQNDVAAMPSLHMAGICVVAFVLARWRAPLGAILAVVYILAMGFALVYLGEHYLSDVVAGLVLAAAVWYVAQRVARHRGGGLSRSTSTERQARSG